MASKTRISNKVQSITPSATLDINEVVTKLRSENVKIYDLGLGEADYPTPEIVTSGLHAVEQTRVTRYTEVAGTPQLRKAISDALSTCFHRPPTQSGQGCGNDLFYSPYEIIVSSGSKHLLYSTVLSLCNPGDEVILLAPYWVSYPDICKLADAKPIIVSAGVEENFIPPAERIEKSISNKTRLIFLNSPNNPTGQVWNLKQIKALADVILNYNNIYLLSDEIYGLITFEDTPHISPATLSDEMKERTIVTNGLSKAYSMGGWRIGFAATSNIDIMDSLLKIAANTISSVPSITQDASINAFKAWDRVEKMRKDFQSRANVIHNRLNEIGLRTVSSKGAFYVFPDVSKLFGKKINGKTIKNSTDVSKVILEFAHIASVPGIAFGNDNHIRLSFVRKVSEIEEACDALERVINKIN